MILQNLFGLDNSLNVPSIPYMGNKRKLATRIINQIIQTVGMEFDNFYDLFGGGGSVSIAALNLDFCTVHYNELNPAICNLMRHIQAGGEIPYRWVTREEFFECLSGDTWWDGLVQSCWAFGNNGAKGYLYGKDIEEIKYLGHKICVDKCADSLSELEKQLGQKINVDLTGTVHKIRIALKRELEKIVRMDIQHLERLKLLEHLQRLQHLQHLQITNLSYDKVLLKNNSVIYCDPPYKDTGEYKEGGFNHDDFYHWAMTIEAPVFISEYSMPEDFTKVASYRHKSTLSATNNNKFVIENLYWNGKYPADLQKRP